MNFFSLTITHSNIFLIYLYQKNLIIIFPEEHLNEVRNLSQLRSTPKRKKNLSLIHHRHQKNIQNTKKKQTSPPSL